MRSAFLKSIPLLLTVLLLATDLRAATFTVTKTADTNDGICDPDCSLREAITAANAAGGADIVAFSVGSGTQTITPASNLPGFSNLTIDGTTQPGFSGTPLIVLNGQDTVLVGLSAVSNAVIRSLAVQDFETGILLTGGDTNAVSDCYIGTDVTGTAVRSNGTGIEIDDSDNNLIDNNLISANETFGVSIGGSASQNNQLTANLIGTDVSGAQELKNDIGVYLFNGAHDNVIGGPSADDDGNTIAFNDIDGILLDNAPNQAGSGNSILKNSIHSHVGLGINLNDDGVTANDSDDPDSLGEINDLQNFPVLSSAVTDGCTVTLAGTFNSIASVSGYDLEFFTNDEANPSGNGEGQTYFTETSVNTDGSGDAAVNVSFPDASSLVQVNQFVAATATNPDGSTSEFSAAHEVLPNVQWSLVSTSVAEEAGTVTLTITRGACADADLPLYVATTNGTATAGSDYQAFGQAVLIPDGQDHVTVAITLIDDIRLEANETFQAKIYNKASGTEIDSITVTINNADTCGDGNVDAGEGCDDGNAVDTDNCPSTCQAAACGDGFVHTGFETCDDGNTVTETCTYGLTACTVCAASCVSQAGETAYCGDATVDAIGGETCDDGNAVGTDACPTNCRTAVCGDGFVRSGFETCDDGNAITDACDYGTLLCSVCGASCTEVGGVTSYCGDRLVDAGNGEVCDVADTTDDVLCASDCLSSQPAPSSGGGGGGGSGGGCSLLTLP